ALRASPAPSRVSSRARPNHARRARPRLQRQRTSLARRPLSDRKSAQHVAGAASLERNRRPAPLRSPEGRAQAHRCAERSASVLREGHLLRAPAPQPRSPSPSLTGGLSSPALHYTLARGPPGHGIPPHMSLPLLPSPALNLSHDQQSLRPVE